MNLNYRDVLIVIGVSMLAATIVGIIRIVLTSLMTRTKLSKYRYIHGLTHTRK